MIEWFTGQPGHGKSLQAIARALEFQKKGRMVYVCNVRDFDYEKTGMLKMTPEDFRNWMDFLPDGAVCLVDEVYEHGMLPKRAASMKLPAHVERLATHRHKGLDFIFVCQSPDKQVDSFVHDLIERHVHVRRRFGTQFQNLRTFDRYERNPEKATPLLIKRTKLPKHVFGLYKSTEMDTTERRIPWYFIAFAVGAPMAVAFFWWTFGGFKARMAGTEVPAPLAAQQRTEQHGASATGGEGRSEHVKTREEYETQFVPRISSQPWSAPAYDSLAVPAEPPRVFCMSSLYRKDVDGKSAAGSCTCLTEQGTRYQLADHLCRAVARYGQYEPFYDDRSQQLQDAQSLSDTHLEKIRQHNDQASTAIPDTRSNVQSFPENKQPPTTL